MTQATACFDVIAAAVTAFGGVMPDDRCIVLNGYGTTAWAHDFVLIGASDPFTSEAAVAVESDSDWQYVGVQAREETGAINCVAYVKNGDADPLAAQARLSAVLDAIAAYLTTDYTLGADWVLWVGMSVKQVDHDQDEDGAWAVATFQLKYTAHVQ